MLKRRHHYVWQEYLRAWNKEDQIYCLRENRIFQTKTNHIAVEKDFYKLKELSPRDLLLLKTLIDRQKSHELRRINETWLEVFTFLHRFRAANPGPWSVNQESAFNEAISNIEENLHALIEGKAIPFLEQLRSQDSAFFVTDEGRYHFLHFLTIQYFRTKRMRKAVTMHEQVSAQFNLNTVWNILSHILGTNSAWAIISEPKFQLKLLVNTTRLNFIAGDQPVINTHSPGGFTTVEVSDLEYYYPVSPKIAILVGKNHAPGAKETINEELKIRYYNDKLASLSNDSLFAQTAEDLEPYLIQQ